jgi:DNA-binding transcriptional regulator YiaG
MRQGNKMSGTEILEFRNAMGLTQTELADELGVSQPAVAQWETGATEPRGSVLKLLEMLRKKQSAKKSRSAVDKGK